MMCTFLCQYYTSTMEQLTIITCFSGSAEDEQVSDEELTELLVEAEGGLSTPSRLRPSTLNQPGHFTGVRRSQRIQTASGANSNPALQPCLVGVVCRYTKRCCDCYYLNVDVCVTACIQM